MEPKPETASELIATLQMPPINSAPIPDQAEGVNAIVKLTREASQVAIVDISTKGLGEGLPDKVPLVIDSRPGGTVGMLANILENYRQRPARRKGTWPALSTSRTATRASIRRSSPAHAGQAPASRL